MRKTRRHLLIACLLLSLLLLGSCRAFHPRPLFSPVVPEGSSLLPLSHLQAQLASAGLMAWLISRGNTTGRVFDLEVTNHGDGPASVDWAGMGAVGWRREFQRYLILTRIFFTLLPGRTFRGPIEGFCMRPGLPPIPTGTRLTLVDMVLTDRTSSFPVVDGTVRGATTEYPVLVAGPGGLSGEQLAPGAAGTVCVGTADGRFRSHDLSSPWTLPAEAPEGVVTVRGPDGHELNEFVAVRTAGPEAVLAAVPYGDCEWDPLTVEEVVEIDVAMRIAARFAPDAATRHEAELRDVAWPATTVAQIAVHKLARKVGFAEDPVQTPTARAADAQIRDEVAAVEAAASEALAAAERAYQAENDIDFSSLNATFKR